MTNTTQINFRVPIDLKVQAQKKAELCGTNLNFLVKLFLTKFVKGDDIVQITQDIDMDKVLDQGIVEYLSSKEGKTRTKKINAMLNNITNDPEEEKKFLA